MLVRCLIFIAVGLALGHSQARSLHANERAFLETGERARPTANFIFWLFVLGVSGAALLRSGPVAFVCAMFGFFLARGIAAVRKHREDEARRPKF